MIYQDRLGTTNVKENSKEDFAHRSRRIRWLALAVAFCVSSQTITPWIPTKRQRLGVFLDSLSFTFKIDNKRLRWLVVALTDDIKSGAQGWIRELHNGARWRFTTAVATAPHPRGTSLCHLVARAVIR
eukprot:COSAG06_NODE_2175_length_7411_cov_86.745897_3_plen_128_part_00